MYKSTTDTARPPDPPFYLPMLSGQEKSQSPFCFVFCQCPLPDICSELFPVLQEHIGVSGLRWVFLKLIWDVEGHGKLRFAGGAGSRDHMARDGCGHLHLGLWRGLKKQATGSWFETWRAFVGRISGSVAWIKTLVQDDPWPDGGLKRLNLVFKGRTLPLVQTSA